MLKMYRINVNHIRSQSPSAILWSKWFLIYLLFSYMLRCLKLIHQRPYKRRSLLSFCIFTLANVFYFILKCTPSWKVCMAPAPCIAVSLFSSGQKIVSVGTTSLRSVLASYYRYVHGKKSRVDELLKVGC